LDGEYFIIQTERGLAKESVIYRACRVVLLMGSRRAPDALGVPGEELKMIMDGRWLAR